MNKTTLFLAFLSIYSIHTNAMIHIAEKKYKKQYRSKSCSPRRNILIPVSQQNKRIKTCYVEPSLLDLPALLKQEIFTIPSLCCTYSCLEDAAKAINFLVRTNTFLNKLINDDKKTLQLIKQLSDTFGYTNIDVARMLCTKAANNRFTLQRAFLVGWNWRLKETKKDINKLKNIGLDLNFSYKKHLPTALLQTTSWRECGWSDVAGWLIKNGADINVCTPAGRNASMIALANYNNPLIDKFLDHPAFNVNHQDRNNDTPLHCCFYGLKHSTIEGWTVDKTRCPKMYEIVKKLLEKGANPIVMNKDGKTPLGLAKESGYQPLIDLLEKAVTEFKKANL